MSTNKPISATEPRKLMSFKKFSLSDEPNGSTAKNETCRDKAAIKRKLREITDSDGDPPSSIFAVIKVGSSDREATLQLLADEIHKMSEKLDIALTCVPLPDRWFTVE